MRKVDDRGVSLVELLVAICILAVVAIPILHSFVTSYRVNAKSRTTMRATTLAQNEMEIFEKEKLENLTDASQFDYHLAVKPNPNDASDPGIYQFSRIGVINDNSGRQEFDVYVTLNPERSDSVTGRYYDANTETLIHMNTLSALDSGSYVQTVRTEHNKKPQDTLVYDEFVTASQTQGTNKDAVYFEQNLERTITIDIIQEPDAGDGTGPTVKAKVTYTYTCTEFGIVPAEKSTKTMETMIFDNSQSRDSDGKKVALKSVYLYYAPRYQANNDVIIVNNSMSLPVDVYILRQDILNDGGTAKESVPVNYKVRLEINDPLDADGKCGGTYQTNLNINEVPETTPSKGQKVSLKLNGTECISDGDRNNAIHAMGLLELGGLQAKDRIYTMTVEVYRHGDVPGTASPLITMTGTKLE